MMTNTYYQRYLQKYMDMVDIVGGKNANSVK